MTVCSVWLFAVYSLWVRITRFNSPRFVGTTGDWKWNVCLYCVEYCAAINVLKGCDYFRTHFIFQFSISLWQCALCHIVTQLWFQFFLSSLQICLSVFCSPLILWLRGGVPVCVNVCERASSCCWCSCTCSCLITAVMTDVRPYMDSSCPCLPPTFTACQLISTDWSVCIWQPFWRCQKVDFYVFLSVTVCDCSYFVLRIS